MLGKVLVICALAVPSAAVLITRVAGGQTQQCEAGWSQTSQSTYSGSCYAAASGSLGPVTLSYNVGPVTSTASLSAAGWGTYTMTLGTVGSDWEGWFQLYGGNWENFRAESLHYSGGYLYHNGNAQVTNYVGTSSGGCGSAAANGGNAAITACYYVSYVTLNAPSVSMSYSASIDSSSGIASFTVTPGKFSNEKITVDPYGQLAKPETNSSSEVHVAKPGTNSSCCWCNGKCCNPSPFKNDNRCVCGPKSSDWKTPAQCGATPTPTHCNPNGNRQDCGYKGINQGQCEAKGCCWSPGNGAWCFNPNSKDNDIMV